MDLRRIFGATLAVAAFTVAALPGLADAQSVADFYKGKDITIAVGNGPGSGYDVYARAIARHWGKHIPGNPNIVIQNMPGAGGIKLMNYLANNARNDGTVIGAAVAGSLIDPVGGLKSIKYDPRKFNWIGNVNVQNTACFTRKASPVKTIEDAMKSEVILAATSARSSGAVLSGIYNELIGTKFKVVTGYSSAGMTLAVERGEADGACLSYLTLIARDPELVEKQKINWLIILNNKSDPALPGVPPASDYVKSKEGRQILDLLASRVTIGRAYAMPAGAPADRVAAVRKAFFATLKDPALLSDAKKLRLQIDPMDHSEIEAVINSAYAMPKEIVNKAFGLMKSSQAAANKAPSVKKKK